MILAIDPSKNNLGWATLQGDTWEWGLLHPKGAKIETRLVDTIASLQRICSNPRVIICEFPTYFNSEKGNVAAVQGYTLELAAICGALLGAFAKAVPHFKTPIQWKGNLNKAAIEFRWKKIFAGFKLPSEHEQEAMMMIHYHVTEA